MLKKKKKPKSFHRHHDAVIAESAALIWKRTKNFVIPALSDSPEAISIVQNFFLALALEESAEDEITSIKEKLEYLFGTRYRDVQFYKSRERVVMNGDVVKQPDQKILPGRVVLRGQLMLVRTDLRTPNEIDVQVLHRLHDITDRNWFRLSQFQWNRIKGKLKLLSKDDVNAD